MPGHPLPPPPPPESVRAWPDRESLLADRARAMGELSRLSMGASRLMLLWLMAMGFATGWGLVGGMLKIVEVHPDVMSVMFAGILACVGVGFMLPTGIVIGLGIRRDKVVRERLRQWSSLDRDPRTDARFRSPALSLCWILPSLLLCALGLWLSIVTPAEAEPGKETYTHVAVMMGLGLILWLTGLLGAAKAVSHYRWAVRLQTAAPTAAGSGAHR
ncbi:hypothetical protein [Streptomyces sp.]|uniref:hypothetical protein n=1 Tax=Streptomyces sp. TaxID=1931 RepID=UPI002D79D7BF|nr:hypothetical protein [Streptomyces sp.]HET6359975.1 hypothetical protein [Streptomyces sp.]